MCSKDFEIRPKLCVFPLFYDFDSWFGNSDLFYLYVRQGQQGKYKNHYLCKLSDADWKLENYPKDLEKEIQMIYGLQKF